MSNSMWDKDISPSEVTISVKDEVRRFSPEGQISRDYISPITCEITLIDSEKVR